MDDIHAAAAQGKDTLAPVSKPNFSEPYWKDQSWFVDESLYPTSREIISRRFDTRDEAEQFIKENEVQNAG